MRSTENTAADYVPKAAVIVAHPDDETLWSGGTILMRTNWNWWVGSLCRGSDSDRKPRFLKALDHLKAKGVIGDMNDDPEQKPLYAPEVEQAVLSALDGKKYDVIITHSPLGEYTRHRRHEETANAVISLWSKGELETNQLWMFAYSDQGKKKFPKPIEQAHRQIRLPGNIWTEKYNIITKVYGFQPKSFEARSAPKQEAFWVFALPKEVRTWLSEQEGVKL